MTVGLAILGLGFEILGLSWGLGWIGASIVRGLATVEIGEVVISALEFSMIGVSSRLNRVGSFIACATIGAEDIGVSVVACGLATVEIGEVVVSAMGFSMIGVSWRLNRVGSFIACATIGAEIYFVD